MSVRIAAGYSTRFIGGKALRAIRTARPFKRKGSGKRLSKENELEPKTETKETQKLAKDVGKAEGFEWNNESNLNDLVG